MYRIYIKDKSIFVTDNTDFIRKTELVSVSKNMLFNSISEIIRVDSKSDLFIVDSDPDLVMKDLKKKLVFIEAAGGLVKNEKDEFLFIYRAGKWDLPKGKLEKKEITSQGAKREVEEECGIYVSEVLEEIPSTFHVYELQNKIILKQTYWFKMTANSNQKLIPQLDEGITDVRWIAVNDFGMVYDNTYPSILQVLEEA